MHWEPVVGLRMVGVWLGIVSGLLGIPRLGFAFDARAAERISPTPVPAQSNPAVTFDNELLERMFGREHGTRNRRSQTMPASIPQLPPVENEALTVGPHESLLRGITRTTKARKAAALRLAEQGRLLLERKDYRSGIVQLEKALSLDANPVVYYYLAQGHYYLDDRERAREFLAVAEAGLPTESAWSAEVVALRAVVAAPPPPGVIKQNVRWLREY